MAISVHDIFYNTLYGLSTICLFKAFRWIIQHIKITIDLIRAKITNDFVNLQKHFFGMQLACALGGCERNVYDKSEIE